MKQIQLTQNVWATIDDDDYERVSQYKWYAQKNTTGGYYALRGVIERGKSKKIFMHQFIMGSMPGCEVDHINRNKLDNRKVNLRFATRSQNMINRTKYKNNTSGHKGVHFRTDNRKWIAYICIDNKLKRLGSFQNMDEAISAREQAVAKRYGAFGDS